MRDITERVRAEELLHEQKKALEQKNIALSEILGQIEICNMIKNGITSKEIASLLNISLGTTERHRNNIRKKLDIVNKDINLSSVLRSL
jgi:DNA-binding CsgD family transcriptional regulator